MSKLINLKGRRVCRLLVLDRAPNRKNTTMWYCRCDCGKETVVATNKLTDQSTKSCGCLSSETVRQRSLKHGHTVDRKLTAEYNAWRNAKNRCLNPECDKYPRYGGRGISMCPKWLNDFEAFLADMGLRPNGTTLDRKNVNGDYEPENCRWATPAEQAKNRTDNVKVVYQGETYILKDLAKRLGLNYKRLHSLYRSKKLSLEEAIAKS